MAKRIADKELTDRNWDQEDEGEEVSLTEIHPQRLINQSSLRSVVMMT